MTIPRFMFADTRLHRYKCYGISCDFICGWPIPPPLPMLPLHALCLCPLSIELLPPPLDCLALLLCGLAVEPGALQALLAETEGELHLDVVAGARHPRPHASCVAFIQGFDEVAALCGVGSVGKAERARSVSEAKDGEGKKAPYTPYSLSCLPCTRCCEAEGEKGGEVMFSIGLEVAKVAPQVRHGSEAEPQYSMT